MFDDLKAAYAASPDAHIDLGGILLDNDILPETSVNLVLKSMNRHGLIAGATGSGKTKTMQVLAEQLSLAGVPSLVMDIKGDVSGLAEPGQATAILEKRCAQLNVPFIPCGFPVELLSLIEALPGVPLRATVCGFGSLLFSRMLDVNETQGGVITVLFEYAREAKIPLVTLDDFKALLRYVQTPAGKTAIEGSYGAVASASIGAVSRKIIELESQGGDQFFGEPAFKVSDLLRVTAEGKGIISILQLTNMQDKPKLFSTFMLKLLTDIYQQFPELGDPDKPKLVVFIDEAHLIFEQASKPLLSLLNTMVKLIRSKGIGLIFCTQTPNDIPDSILSQLGLKIQHALRAFTAKDRQMMKLVAQNFPESKYYATERLLTALGIGDALVCALDAKGQPTPLIACRVRPPQSRMGTLSATEINTILQQSHIYPFYQQLRITPKATEALDSLKDNNPDVKGQKNAPKPKTEAEEEPSIVSELSKNTLIRQLIRQFFRQITEQLFRALGLKKTRRR